MQKLEELKNHGKNGNAAQTSSLQDGEAKLGTVEYEQSCKEYYDVVIKMDLYFLVGNALHYISLLYLLTKLVRAKSCEGVSGKTQLLFFIAIVTRYMDVFLANYDSFLPSIGKLAYIALHLITVLMIFIIFEKSYKRTEDTLVTEVVLWTSVIMAIHFSNEMSRQKITYAFSMFLESLAILPQFYMTHKRGELEKSLLYYLILVGLDRLAYLLNWIYRFSTEMYVDQMTNATGSLHLTMFLVASLLFLALRFKITERKSGEFLRSNIFLVSDNHPYREMVEPIDEKNSDELSVEKV